MASSPTADARTATPHGPAPLDLDDADELDPLDRIGPDPEPESD